MQRRNSSILLASVVLFGGLQGCNCPNRHRGTYSAVAPRPALARPCPSCTEGGPVSPRFAPNPPPFAPAPPPAVPSPPSALSETPSPSAGLPTITPPAGAVPPPPAANIPRDPFVPAVPANPPTPANPPAPANPSALSDPIGSFYPPAPPAGVPNVRLQAPQPINPDAARPMPNAPEAPTDTARRYPSQTSEPPAAPPLQDKDKASPAMPVDIPQFAAVKSNIANGQEPFAGGVQWLKTHGYRAVLHIRAPGEDDAEARRSFEQSGLRYLSLEVSPQTLSKDIVDQFNRFIADNANLPLFVYDKDGSLTGGLWYLYFRLVDKKDDANAREDAAHLGFRTNDEGPHKAMWLAVQNYLAMAR